MSEQRRGTTPKNTSHKYTPAGKASTDNSPVGKSSSGNAPPDNSAPEDFESDIKQLVAELKAALGDGATRWYYDELSETLYVELESLSGMTEEDIEKKAGPVLDECDVDFEEIILLPFTQ